MTPCYNEAENVQNHYARVRHALAPFMERYDFEHIYTDNQSTDETFSLLALIASKNPNVRVLRFSRNVGANRAIILGLQAASGNAVILIQADLQDPPELIPTFIQTWEQGVDIAYGKITGREENWIMVKLRELYYRTVSLLAETEIPRNAGEFRITSRRALDAMLQFREDDIYLRGVAAQVGFIQKAIPYQRAARAGGKSTNNLFRLFGYGWNGILSTTMAPLKFVTFLGLIFSSVGFFLTFSIIASKLIASDKSPHGFASLASIVTLFSGVQILSIGILGEYIRKIYVQTLDRPRGFIQDKINA